MKQSLKRYSEVRSSIRSGDLLLFRPSTISSEMIAAVGRSEYSHAAMAVWWNGTLMCVEMDYSGGRAVTLSSQVNAYSGHYDLYRTNPYGRRPFNRNAAVEHMVRFAGTKYGWKNVIRLSIRHLPIVRLLIKPPTDDEANGSAAICSQAFSKACRVGGVDPVPQLADRATEPGDLARSDFFRYLWTLVAT